MTEKQKQILRISLLQTADNLLREALKLRGHHPCFGEAVVDAQSHVLDGISWADKKWKSVKKKT